LKVGWMIHDDMKIRSAVTFMTSVEVQTEDGSQKPAAECSSGSYTAVLDSWNLNEKTGKGQHEQSPDVDDEDHCSDVDASLMGTETGSSECQAEQPAAHRDSFEVQHQRANGGAQNGGSLDQDHGDSLASLDVALDHEAASEKASVETGVPTRTSPAAPPLRSHAPPLMNQLWFMHPPNKL
jgi:hypothetical protein